MNKYSLALVILLGLSTQASAAFMVEDFTNFPSWQTGWLGTHSNLANFGAVQRGLNSSDRYGNLDGLWLDDNDGSTGNDNNVKIIFDTDFGKSLQTVGLSLASYIDFPTLEIEFFDSNGQSLFAQAVAPTYGATTNPGVYEGFSVSSITGIGGFVLRTPSQTIEGNVGIDNVFAISADVVIKQPEDPVVDVAEPTSWMLFAGAMALFLRRRSQR